MFAGKVSPPRRVVWCCVVQVHHWADLAAAAGQLLAQTLWARRPGVHVMHVASEMVPVAKVRRDRHVT